jgi:hypothetical protein
MAEAADGLMPEPNVNTQVNKDVFDVLLHNVRPLEVKADLLHFSLALS